MPLSQMDGYSITTDNSASTSSYCRLLLHWFHCRLGMILMADDSDCNPWCHPASAQSQQPLTAAPFVMTHHRPSAIRHRSMTMAPAPVDSCQSPAYRILRLIAYRISSTRPFCTSCTLNRPTHTIIRLVALPPSQQPSTPSNHRPRRRMDGRTSRVKAMADDAEEPQSVPMLLTRRGLGATSKGNSG